MQKEILKKEIKKNYGKIALERNNSNSCCMPNEFQNNCIFNITLNSIENLSNAIGYQEQELQSIPKESILGLGCGVPLSYADIREGETVVDLGSGAGIRCTLDIKKSY